MNERKCYSFSVTLIKARKLKSLDEKTKGLLGLKVEPVYFETRWGIHTFFMREPIDIVILDASKRVAVIKEGLKPNRIFLWNPIYSKVLELPSNTIKGSGIKLTDEIKLILKS